MATESEGFFEELADACHIEWRRLPVLKVSKQPDYELTLAGHRVVVEVKQLEPNDADRAVAASLSESRWADQTRNPDAMARRVREQIDRSRPQLKSYLGRHPPRGRAELIEAKP